MLAISDRDKMAAELTWRYIKKLKQTVIPKHQHIGIYSQDETYPEHPLAQW